MCLGWVSTFCGWEDLAQVFSRVPLATGSVVQKTQMCFSPNFTQDHFPPNFSPCFSTEWIPEKIASGNYGERAVGLLEVPGWYFINVQGGGRLQPTYWCRRDVVWTAEWKQCGRHSQPFLGYREISVLFSNIHTFFFSSLDIFSFLKEGQTSSSIKC